MSKLSVAAIAIIVGLGIGAGGALWVVGKPSPSTVTDNEKTPLYWVAPMDANYRRDKPGKSPMGMDLVPVYEDGGEQPGVVRVAPEVVSNLGVRTAQVERARLNKKISTVGYVQYNQDQLVHINPRIAGWIDKLHVRSAGARVEAGQPLYQLYSPELVNAQQELLMALHQGSEPLVRAAEQRLRAWKIPQKFITQLRKSGEVQQTISYSAPQSGYLAVLNVRQGEYVQPGQVLMAIGTLDDIWVEAQVFAEQATMVKPGLMVRMTSEYFPGKSWRGSVDYVYPALDPVTRTLPVRIKLANDSGELKPNMFADLTIHNLSEKPTTVVPKEAVIRTGQMDRVVLALGNGRFKSVVVTTGRTDDRYIEVLDGVQVGESIVTSAQFLLDSESSKTAEFKRFAQRSGEAKQPMANVAPEKHAEIVQVAATIDEIMPAQRALRATHAPVESWGWPAMTMNFNVAKRVDLAALEAGEKVQLTIEKRGPQEYLVTEVDKQAMEEASADKVRVDATIHEIMLAERTLNVTHGPIKTWGWPAMTMNFDVAEGVDMTALQPEQHVRLIMEKRGPRQHLITAIAAQEQHGAAHSGANQPLHPDAMDHKHAGHQHMSPQNAPPLEHNHETEAKP